MGVLTPGWRSSCCASAWLDLGVGAAVADLADRPDPSGPHLKRLRELRRDIMGWRGQICGLLSCGLAGGRGRVNVWECLGGGPGDPGSRPPQRARGGAVKGTRAHARQVGSANNSKSPDGKGPLTGMVLRD